MLVTIFKDKQNLFLRCHRAKNCVREKIFNVLQSGHYKDERYATFKLT